MKGEKMNKRNVWSFGATLVAAVLILGGTAQAVPVLGVFESEEFGGDIMDGRWSESFVGGGPEKVGNILNAASWDGTDLVAGTLGTQWTLSGMTLSSVNSLGDDWLGALRIEKWFTTYNGGTLALKQPARDGNSLWWGEDPGSSETEYVVNITNYAHNTQVTYFGNTMVGTYSLVTLTG